MFLLGKVKEWLGMVSIACLLYTLSLVFIPSEILGVAWHAYTKYLPTLTQETGFCL